MNLKFGLDLVIVLALTTQFISLTDLLVSQKQQQKLNELFNCLNNTLTYASSGKWYTHNTRIGDAMTAFRRIVKWVISIIIGLVAVLMMFVALSSGDGSTSFGISFLFWIGLVVFFFLYRIIESIHNALFRVMSRSILESRSVKFLLVSASIVCFAIGITFIIYIIAVSSVAIAETPQTSSLVGVIAIWLLGLFAICLVDAVIVSLVSIAAFSMRLSLILIHYIVARIAEYPKGSLAAIVALIGGTCGIFRILITGK